MKPVHKTVKALKDIEDGQAVCLGKDVRELNFPEKIWQEINKRAAMYTILAIISAYLAQPICAIICVAIANVWLAADWVKNGDR